ncbi:MAG TPA: 3-keto-5-aminohexanoate cleavage protein [Streptosporangiaceae bacterium]|nr:3-keto-5-aminohexanoate cleavage protein [Streptosporangiaceae bacterium]
MADRVRRIKACLNGGRDPAEHPAVPVTPEQLATAAAAAVSAGAEALHVHPRGSDGRESVRAADVGAAIAAIREASPRAPVGVTTGLWVTGGDVVARREDVAEWADLPPERRPDFASVNISEPGWQELVAILDETGIGVEAGVWSVADAATAASADADWLRILVEVGDPPSAGATARADEILAQLSSAGTSAPVLLHGAGDSCWPLVVHAGLLGLATRIGLEDVLAGPHGQQIADNAELVRLALVEWTVAPSG